MLDASPEMSPFSSFPRKQPRASTSTTRSAPETPRSSVYIPSTLASLFGARVDNNAVAEMKAVAMDMAQTITSMAADVADTLPFPGLKVGLLALAEVVKKIQIMQATVEGVATLQQRIESLVASIHELRQRPLQRQLPPEMVSRIDGLVKTWERIGKRAASINSPGKVMRFVKSNSDAKKLGDLIGEINDSIQDKVVTQGILNIESYVFEIHADVKAIRASLHTTTMLRYARMAPYNSNEVRRSCLKGTRVQFLNRIFTWITAAYKQGKVVPDDGTVLWINGLGGTGKTTVARSVAECCDSHGILGGSFFCSRSDNDCNNPNLVFLTLCHQLCEQHQAFKDKVEAVLEHTPDVVNYGPFRQFEALIVRPLEALGPSFPRFVYVIDALDECKDRGAEATKSMILSVIAKFASRIARFLLFVVTSRPEEEIAAFFESSRKDSLKDISTILILHDVPLEIALEDIRLYLDNEFEANIGFLAVEPGWPSTEEKNALVEQSRGLFIYVATAIKFIMDRAHGNPKGRLNLLLSDQPDSSSPHEFLSTLYSTIMVASSERASPELVDNIRNVLGTILLAQEALSTSAVSCLLGLSEDSIRNALTRLHSVVHVPAESHQPIRIIHPTFPEFLLQSPYAITFESTEPASTPAALHLQPTVQHWYLFARSIVTMSSALKRDMIGIRYPATFRNEIDNFKERVQFAVQPHVSYASRFWGVHLRDGIGAAATLDVFPYFCDFAHTQLLYWLETCSLLDAMDRVTFTLDMARSVCQTLGGQFADLVSLLTDCHRFVLTYSPCIHAAPLQVYHSGVAPTGSDVRTTYAHEFQHALVIDHGTHADWTPCIDAFSGHGGFSVYAIAFSPDGSYFVTGGGNNKSTVWKTATRSRVISFYGHTGPVRCVAFSPDGLYIVSGSEDKSVYVWRALSGEHIHTLERHRGAVFSVTYSGDGHRILSATDGGEMKLWDAADGHCLFIFDRTTPTVQVAISFDGSLIAHIDGDSPCLFKVSSYTSEILGFPGKAVATTFSSDGRYVAARSHRVIRIWACMDKSLVRSIDVPNHLTGRLAFSRDGNLIGCGSRNGSVQMWQVTSDDPPRILQGHTNWVNDLACSPDRSQAISVSLDGMIRVWDGTQSSDPIAARAMLQPLAPTPGPPCFALIRSGYRSIALLHLPSLGIDAEHFPIGAEMPDGAPTATLFTDVVNAWDAALQVIDDRYGHSSARAWASLIGQPHTQLSWRPFATSLDGSMMAYPSPVSDSVVDVCDLRTGTVVVKFVGHTRDVLSIAFSPDNTCLATGSGDKSVQVWDTLTGGLNCGHTEHREPVYAIAFSPNGRLVASGSWDKTVRVFDVVTQRVSCVLRGRRDSVMHVMFSADNVHLVALDLGGRVYVCDIASEARVWGFSLQDHHHLRSPVVSPDGVRVRGEVGVQHTIPLWTPGTRTWPAYHVTRDGWVYALRPGRTQRLGWIPPERREALGSDGSVLCTREAESDQHARRKLIVLNMSQIQSYVDSLDTPL